MKEKGQMNDIFRSRLSFVIYRAVIPGFVLSSISAGVVGYDGIAVSMSVILTATLSFGIICWILYRARIIAGPDRVISVGYLHTRVIKQSEIERFSAEPTWYSWRRMVVPCALILITKDGSRLRIPGVQSHLWNIGIIRNNIDVFLSRSYPMAIAHILNERYCES